jgi:hypothetical protein
MISYTTLPDIGVKIKLHKETKHDCVAVTLNTNRRTADSYIGRITNLDCVELYVYIRFRVPVISVCMNVLLPVYFSVV